MHMSSKPKVKALIFDLGGVIMSGGYLPFIHQYCLACLTPEGRKKISDLEHQVNLGSITEQQFYREIRKIFNILMTPEHMRAHIVKRMQVNKSLLHLLPKVKRARLVLFSNSIGNMAIEVLRRRRFPIKKIFDKLFLSNKIHLAKPDTKAYQYVLKKLKVRPEEALMVDDRAKNIASAKKLGMHGIVFKTTTQFQKDLRGYDLTPS